MTPSKAYGKEDVGWDIHYWGESKNLLPDRVYDLRTGLYIAPDPGYWVELCQRSSAFDHGYGVLRGIIDNGYRGELIIRVMPFRSITIHNHMKMAQLIFHEIVDVEWVESEELPASTREKKGFGSSGH